MHSMLLMDCELGSKQLTAKYRLMSQAKLAQAAGVGEMTIVRLERGNEANELTVYKLAKALETTVQQLLEEGPPEQTTIDSAAWRAGP